MKKSSVRRLALWLLVGAGIFLCYSCQSKEPAGPTAEVPKKSAVCEVKAAPSCEAKPAEPCQVKAEKPCEKKAEAKAAEGTAEKGKKEPAAAAPEDVNIVAKIGDYTITKKQVFNQMMADLNPYPMGYREGRPAVTARSAALKLLGDKAVLMNARKTGVLETEWIQESMARWKKRELVGLLMKRHLEGRLTATEEEINKKMQENPRLSKDRAEGLVKRAKAIEQRDQYLKELSEKYHLQKVGENIAQTVEIHRRLLETPVEGRRRMYIGDDQIKKDLTEDERQTALATFDGGKVTLKDWFEELCESAPPSRPKNLDKVEGVEGLLERATMKAIFYAEALATGLEKDPEYLKQLREQEDSRLLGEARNRVSRDIKEPNEEVLLAYFNAHKQDFRVPDRLKIDQIWCEDLKAAQKVRAELDGGKDFAAVKKEYSLAKEAPPVHAFLIREGPVFKEMWKAEPNDIIGPIKGLYSEGYKWRVVKVLEKIPGQDKEYDDEAKGGASSAWRMDKTEELQQNLSEQCLARYEYKIYEDRLAEVDPLNVP